MVTDRELMRRSMRRDHDAFAEIFDRHGEAVYRYACSLVRSPDDAQDLVQETFMTAWRRLADIHLVGDSLLPWLFVACRNHGANFTRSQRVRAAFPLSDGDVVTAEDTLNQLIEAEQLAWIRKAVEDLDPTDQRIVDLCLYEGRDYAEAAALLGLSVGVITKRVHRTRSRLRAQRGIQESEVGT